MNKTATKNQKLFDLYVEYQQMADTKEKEYREFEERFHRITGFFAIPIESDLFLSLDDKQQQNCRAFWSNQRVNSMRNEMLMARMLATTYFNAFADARDK